MGPPGSSSDVARTGASVFCLVAIAVALSASAWTGPVRWVPDGIFYQAMTQEIRGQDAAAARNELLLGRYRAQAVAALGYRLNPAWIDYQAALFRRRWGVPVAAAAISPVFGDRSLLAISLASYAALGPALFLLLRRRFTITTALIVAGAALLLPPVSSWAAFPLTDLPSLLLLTLALLAASVALERGRGWTVVWAAVMLLYGFTRESAVVAALAACWVALWVRSRRTATIAVVGIAALLPAPLLFGAHVRRTLAFSYSGNDVPPHDDWGYLAHRYWPYLRWMVSSDLPSHARPAATVGIWLAVVLLLVHPRQPRWRDARDLALAASLGLFGLLLVGSALGLVADSSIPTGLVLAFGLVLLVPIRSRNPYVELMRGAGLAALGFVLVNPQWTAFRYELVLVPAAAVGYAAALEAPLATARAYARHIARPSTASSPAR